MRHVRFEDCLGEGAFKVCYALPNDRVALVGYKLGHTKRLQARLRKYKVPTHTYRWGKVFVEDFTMNYCGRQRALFTKRYAVHSRDRNLFSMYDHRSRNWQRNFAKSLRVIFSAIFRAGIYVRDFQLLVDGQGNAVVTDPLSIWKVRSRMFGQEDLSQIYSFFEHYKIRLTKEMRTWRKTFPDRYRGTTTYF